MYRHRVFWAIFGILTSAGMAHAQNLIVNPGFESPVPVTGGLEEYTFNGNTNPYSPVGDWTFGTDGTVNTQDRFEWFASGAGNNWNPLPHSGSYAVELNSDSPAARVYAQPELSTPLAAGRSYVLSFWVAPEANWTAGASVTTIYYQVTTGAANTPLFTGSIAAPTDVPQGSVVWTHVTGTFTATAAMGSTIRIFDGIYIGGTNSNYDAALGYSDDINLDDFSLTIVTPEPGTYAAGLLLLGLVCIAERRRLRYFCGQVLHLFHHHHTAFC